MSAFPEAVATESAHADPVLADPRKLFAAGRHLLEKRQYREALAALQQAAELDPTDVSYRSLYGLCLVESGRGRDHGLRLCREAVQQSFCHVDLYVNLAKAHLVLGNRYRAVAVLRKGTALEPGNQSIRDLQREVGRRRRPVFPFLRRSHPLNRFAGRLRHTLTRSSGRSRSSDI